MPVEPVDVFIDGSGVPHIYGKSDRDAFFGAGYIQAVHRLYQMDIARRRAHGRLAEVLGDDALGDDRLARLFNWRGLGQRISELTSQENPEEWAVLEAWAAGVNRRVDEVLSGAVPLPFGFGPSELDYQPEHWEPADPLIIATMTRFGNDESIEPEIFLTIGERMLYPDQFGAIELLRPAHDVFTVPPEDVPMVPRSGPGLGGAPAQADVAPSVDADAPLRLDKLARLRSLKPGGSNNFAIHGRFTESGRPLLCGDPHQGFSFPGIFYALHINSADAGGTFDVAGFTFPGTAGVALGQDERVAWTATTAFADVMDIWDVPVINYETLELGGVPTSVVTREEVIHVRGAADDVMEYRDVPGLGVVLPANIAPLPVASMGRVLVVGWPGYQVNRPAELLDIDRADSLDGFEAAIDRQFGLNFNMLAADAESIGLRIGLEVPKRDLSDGKRPWLVMDGSDPAQLWSGEALPRELLPRGRASERGWIVTANNDPFGFTANGRVDDDPWYFGALFEPGWRAKRLTDEVGRLTARGAVTLDDVMALDTDIHSNLADDLLPLLSEAWTKVPTDATLAAYTNRPELETLAELLLTTWDRRMARDSSGALAFYVYEHELTSQVLKDDIELMYDTALELQSVFVLKIGSLIVRGEYPNGGQVLQEGRDVALLEALSRTAALLTERFGSVDPAGYRWGDMHQSSWHSSLGADLDFGSRPSDGGESTVNVSSATYAPGGIVADQWVSHQGPIFRMCFTFAADGTPEMHFNFPLGNVAHPDSPHFADVLDDWIEGRFRVMPFARADVEASAQDHLVLTSGGRE